MKKLVISILIAVSTLLSTSCNNQKSKINGMNIDYERISYIESKDYGIIEDSNIILYVTSGSGSFTPSVERLKMEKEILVTEVELRAKGKYATCDMAYWKITIDADYDYVSKIQNVDVYVRKG
ncbi:MAG: hypothetical protein ACLSUV_01715 [Bacilli bacterium]